MPRMYRGEDNQLVAFPMGGIGAGTICLEGTGALSHVSLYHRPDLLHEPNAFAALTIRRRSFEPYLAANRRTEKPVIHISLNRCRCRFSWLPA